MYVYYTYIDSESRSDSLADAAFIMFHVVNRKILKVLEHHVIGAGWEFMSSLVLSFWYKSFNLIMDMF